MSVLEIKDLRKRYGTVTALDGLTLSCDREIYGLIGPNGAGKSTALAILMGLLRADAGMAAVAGFEVGTHPLEVKRRTGFLPEEPFFYEYLTGEETLHFVEAAHEVCWTKNEFLRNWIEQLDMVPHLDQLVGHYSHGMRQKLAIFLTLLHDPVLMLWDEPYVGLDYPSQEKVKRLLGELKERGKTVVISTHVLPLVESAADRVGFILDGRLRWEGENPGNLARLFADVPGMGA
jgi:ABC-2 type transport system ATP-binding protein